MPDEERDTAVAEATAPPENGAKPEADAAAAPQESPEITQLRQENARLKQRAQSAEGRLKGALNEDALEALENRLTSQIKTVWRQVQQSSIESSDADESEKGQRIQRLRQEEAQEREQQEFSEHRSFLSSSVAEALEDAGLTEVDTLIAPFAERWRSAKTKAEVNALYRQVLKTVRDYRGEKARRDAEAAQARRNRENGSLALGSSGGTGSGPSTKTYAERLKGDNLPSPEEIDRMTAKYLT